MEENKESQAAENTSVEDQPRTQEEVEAQSKGNENAQEPVYENTTTKEPVAEGQSQAAVPSVEERMAKIENMMEKLGGNIENQSKSFQEALNRFSQPKDQNKPLTLEELRNYEKQIDSGELDSSYRAIISEKRAEIIANRAKDEAIKEAEVKNQWDQSWLKAVEKYPDLKNTNSEHFKLAQQIVNEDPGFSRYSQLKTGGKTPDFSLIDTNLQEKAADIAAQRLEIKKRNSPQSPGKDAAKTELGGHTMHKAAKGNLQSLLEKAERTGDRLDWQRFFVERAKQQK